MIILSTSNNGNLIAELRSKYHLRCMFFLGYQQHRCYLCTELMTHPRSKRPGHRAKLNWTEDHVHPRARNRHRDMNTALAHSKCNTTKGARKPTACEVFFAAEMWRAFHRFRNPATPKH